MTRAVSGLSEAHSQRARSSRVSGLFLRCTRMRQERGGAGLHDFARSRPFQLPRARTRIVRGLFVRSATITGVGPRDRSAAPCRSHFQSAEGTPSHKPVERRWKVLLRRRIPKSTLSNFAGNSGCRTFESAAKGEVSTWTLERTFSVMRICSRSPVSRSCWRGQQIDGCVWFVRAIAIQFPGILHAHDLEAVG